MAKNIRGASKAATRRALNTQAARLGTDESQFDTELSVLETIVGEFIERVQANISKEKNFVTTGKISDISIKVVGDVVHVMANPHLIFQDRGVNGSKKKRYDTPHRYTDKRPPASAFIDWVKSKQGFLTAKNDYHRKMDDRISDQERSEDRPFKELTDQQKIERAAWAVSTKIFNEGFRPRRIYSKEIPKLIDDLTAQFTDFAIQQINQKIDINPRDGGGNRTIPS
ncbi:hypothetical protein [Flaviaesturariibacter amylovorans]|uniref:Uncharacterized protein n=1 Tax=Flaviaesturariibacter amylovorans TaxID=1084520 RepID=A0ABP8GKX7_9BACT